MAYMHCGIANVRCVLIRLINVSVRAVCVERAVTRGHDVERFLSTIGRHHLLEFNWPISS
jgi:hypothetical protein